MTTSKKRRAGILRAARLSLFALGSLFSTAHAQTSQRIFSAPHLKPLLSAQGQADAAPGSASIDHELSARDRLKWFLDATAGPKSLVGGLFSAGLGTAIDAPSEYGPHWDGFGKRYGMRLTGVSTGNAIEASLGAALHEDPRYFPATHRPFGTRVKNIVDLTFRAYHPDGQKHLADARMVATFGNNFLSNTWRAPSEADWQHALVRTAEGYGARALSNTFAEFAPQLWRKLHR